MGALDLEAKKESSPAKEEAGGQPGRRTTYLGGVEELIENTQERSDQPSNTAKKHTSALGSATWRSPYNESWLALVLGSLSN